MSTVLNAKTYLESLGHTFVPFKIENDWDIVKLMNDIAAVDFGPESHFKKLFANEPPARGLEMLRATCGRPDWRRRLDAFLSNVTKPGTREYSTRLSLLSQAGTDQHLDRDVWDMIYQKNQLVSKLLAQMKENDLDLILAPAFPFPACRLNDTETLFGIFVLLSRIVLMIISLHGITLQELQSTHGFGILLISLLVLFHSEWKLVRILKTITTKEMLCSDWQWRYAFELNFGLIETTAL